MRSLVVSLGFQCCVVAAMGSTGLTLADLPNIFIMIGALVALFAMLVILLRNMEFIGIVGEGRHHDAWAMQPPRLLMQRVHIPFTFKLEENHSIGYSGVSSIVSSTVRYYHASWWGAPVRELHATLWGSLPHILASPHLSFTRALLRLPRWCSASGMFAHARVDGFPAIMRARCAAALRRLRDSRNSLLAVIADRMDSQLVIHWTRVHSIVTSYTSNPHDERPLRLSSEEPLQLGPPPRTCYPLVVILARDPRDTAELRPDDTVALVSVVHIRDDQCPLPSGIIAQYLKQANGHLSCLKQLYVTGEQMDEAERYAGAGGEGAALCCVCASAPLSRALLPCRHACLCAHCLPKLDKCPICRSAITSYFCIRNDEEPLSELKQQRFPFNRRLFNLFHYH